MSAPRRVLAVTVGLMLTGGGTVLAKGKGFNIPKTVSSVVVTRYEKISDSRDTPDKKKVSVIKNTETVARLVSLVNSLPPAGNAMIKMGDVELIHADFYWHDDKPPVAVKLFDGWVKAPDTSFYEGLPAEKEIYDILKNARPMPKKGLRVMSPVSVRVEEYHHAMYEVDQFPPNRTVEIKDRKTVERLAGWVNKLPLKGEMFVSFTALVPITQVFFVDDKGMETEVVFYNQSVSTTDGSFYAGNKEGEGLQEQIWTVLQESLGRVAPERRAGFVIGKCQSVEIQRRSTIAGPLEEGTEVTDPRILARCAALLSKLPPTGDVMKEWGDDTEVLSAAFSRPGAPKTVIEFYNGRIQTPSTGFYAAGINPETPLYKLLKKQLKEGK